MTTKYQCQELDTGTVNTCEFRLAGPLHLKTANDRGKFSLRALFPLDADLTVLKDKASAVAVAKWGDKAGSMGLKTPFRKQDEKDYDGYTPGAVFMNMSSGSKPGAVDQAGADIMDYDKDLYAGCWVRANVTVKEFDVDGNRGVTVYVNHVQKLWDDEAFKGEGASASDCFEPVAGASDNGTASKPEGSDAGGLFG